MLLYWNVVFLPGFPALAKAKWKQSSFNKSLHCHTLLVRTQIPRVLCLRHAVVFLCPPRKLLGHILMIFECVLAIWLRSITVKISDMPCTGEVVGLSARKLETVWPFFLKCILMKSISNVNFSGKSFKFAMLMKFYP